MKFDCPHCGQRLEPEPGLYGTEQVCPSCSESVTIPVPYPAWKTALLWVAVLPAALLANVAAYWLMSACWWLGGSMNGNDSRMFTFLMAAATHGMSGYALSYVGAWVAPSGKYVVAVVFAGLVLLFSGAGVALSIRDHQWMELLKITATIAGAIIAAVHVHADPPKF